ncbi:hypothetical protein C8J57DRAFT_1459456 [Mycena rebaudengoi]|nr:hypothetical protein C8J57DRAFT_1459456 [Mycena rebaudengoi]
MQAQWIMKLSPHGFPEVHGKCPMAFCTVSQDNTAKAREPELRRELGACTSEEGKNRRTTSHPSCEPNSIILNPGRLRRVYPGDIENCHLTNDLQVNERRAVKCLNTQRQCQERRETVDVGARGVEPGPNKRMTFLACKVACASADWLVSGVGVDFGGITRPRPAFRLASHFVGLASHSASLPSVKWLALIAQYLGPYG